MSAQFFRVDGADQETGEETYLVLQAPTKPQAEKLARQQGLLISAVRIARPDDWSAPATPSPAPETELQLDPDPVPVVDPPPAFGPLPPLDSMSAVESPASEPALRMDASADSFAGPSPFVDAHSPMDAHSLIEPAPQPLDPVPALPSMESHKTGSSAGAVFLGCIGAALLLGGVLALVLALWPENAVRNELQQIDFRLHEVSQTILGGMLVLGGLVIFVLAVICQLFAKHNQPQ
jgi:hypothetical protein